MTWESSLLRNLLIVIPDLLKKSLGVVGLRLWFYANGVDESNVNTPYKTKGATG